MSSVRKSCRHSGGWLADMPHFSSDLITESVEHWKRFICCFMSFFVTVISMGRSRDVFWLTWARGNNESQYCLSERAIEVFGSGCFVNKSKMNMGVIFCYLPAVTVIRSCFCCVVTQFKLWKSLFVKVQPACFYIPSYPVYYNRL